MAFTLRLIRDNYPDVEPHRSDRVSRLSGRDRISILLEEYRSLNALLLFRLTAMDRRLPVSIGFMAAAITAMLALPLDARTGVLVVTPLALLWLVRTTVQHARAKEDHLRRIDEIERAINSIAGEELLSFQSRHPNRRKAAGRTGNATAVATSSGALGMLILCVFIFLREVNPLPLWGYIAYVGAIAIDLIVSATALSRYRYQKPASVVLPD